MHATPKENIYSNTNPMVCESEERERERKKERVVPFLMRCICFFSEGGITVADEVSTAFEFKFK